MTECYIAHIISGRLRLKFPKQRRNIEFFESVQRQLVDSKIFLNVRTNPSTGSIILEFDRDSSEILNELKKLNIFEIKESVSEMPSQKLTTSIFRNVEFLNDLIKKISQNTLDFKSVVFIFLIVNAIYQIARGNLSFIPWYAALFYLNSLISKN